MFFSTFRRQLVALAHALASELTKIVTLSFVLGSKAAYFSLGQCFAPLVGAWATPGLTFIIHLIRSVWTCLYLGVGVYISSVYHVPTFCGALYLSSHSRLIRIGIPLVCMVAFIGHPVGNQVFLYSFYWLIPIAIAYRNSTSFFLRSLGSTFTTHAVGSVIWLYTRAVPVSVWYNLIGIVWIERLMFACAMTLIYTTVSQAIILWRSNRYKNTIKHTFNSIGA